MQPLLQYVILFAIIAGTAGLAGMLYLIKKSLGKTIEEPGKNLPAESGNASPKPAWNRYHIHYYGFALLFLAFDMEMAYMYPWAVVYRQLGITALADMGVFLLILFLGLIYTWTQGGLKRQ
jgi:NADH-quinone oxidoreductase subunit A